MVKISERRLSEELTLGGVTVSDISVIYPFIKCESTRVTKRINAFYAHWAKTLMRTAKKSALAAASAEYLAALETSAVFRPLTVTATYKTTYNDGHILSLHRDFQVRAGNTVRAQARLGDTWCVSSGWFLELRSFFPCGEKWRRTLTKNAAEHAAALLRAGTHSFYSNYAKLIGRKFSPDNFYITDTGIIIFFARGAIAPESEGIPAFGYTPDTHFPGAEG